MQAFAAHPDRAGFLQSLGLRKALSPAFAAVARAAKSPYNGGDTSGKICTVLRRFDLTTVKTFYDGPVPAFDPQRSITL